MSVNKTNKGFGIYYKGKLVIESSSIYYILIMYEALS